MISSHDIAVGADAWLAKREQVIDGVVFTSGVASEDIGACTVATVTVMDWPSKRLASQTVLYEIFMWSWVLDEIDNRPELDAAAARVFVNAKQHIIAATHRGAHNYTVRCPRPELRQRYTDHTIRLPNPVEVAACFRNATLAAWSEWL